MTILRQQPYLKNVDHKELIRVMGIVLIPWTDIVDTDRPNVILFKNHGAEVAWLDTAAKQAYIHV